MLLEVRSYRTGGSCKDSSWGVAPSHLLCGRGTLDASACLRAKAGSWGRRLSPQPRAICLKGPGVAPPPSFLNTQATTDAAWAVRPELEYTPEFPYLVPRIPRWDAEAVSDCEERSSPVLHSLLYLPQEPLRGWPCPIQALATPWSKQGTLAAQASLVLEAGSVRAWHMPTLARH